MQVLNFGARGLLGAAALLSCGADATVQETVTFSRMRVEEITANRAVVRFDTSLETSCELEFGPSEAALDQRATDPEMDPDNPFAYDHQVPLEDLSAGQQIYFRARTTTRSGLVFRSEMDSFRTTSEQVAGGSNELSPDDVSFVELLTEKATVVEVSSNFGAVANGDQWGIDAAFDGLMATEWSSNGDGDNAFVLLEFSQPEQLQAFGYRSRKMADGSSIVLSVRLVLDGTLVLGPFATPDPDKRYFFVFDEAETATQVRVEAVETTGGNTGAKEIELYGRN